MSADVGRASPPEPTPPVLPTLLGSRRWIGWTAVFGVAVLVFLLTRADLTGLLETIRGIAPLLLALPILATVGSYVTMARSYQEIAAVAGWRLPFGDMCRITLVANTANYLLSTAGLSGFALRMYLFTRRGVPTGTAVIISLVQTLLTNLVLLVFVITGFALLLVSHSLMGRDLVVAGTLLVSFTALVIVACAAILQRDMRRRVLFVGADIVDRTLRRIRPHQKPRRFRLMRFQHNLNVGLDFLLERPHQMLGPTVYIVLDWIFTLLVLYSSFVAIGHPIAMSYVIAGFAIGMFFSIASLVPGGLGVLEGSMAAVFASLAVPLEQAVVAVLIFRVAYYVVPLLVSVVLVRPTLRGAAP